MEHTNKNVSRGINRPNVRNTPVKSVPPRVKNTYIRANCGSAPVRKIHDCLGQTLSRGDTWHNTLQRKSDMREEPPIYSERSSVLSISTMTTMNNGKRLNMMTTCDPVHGIKFIVREFKQRLKALYPDDEIFYQMISEIGYLLKRVEYGEVQEEHRSKRYVEKVVEKCCKCEGMSSVVSQMEEDLACEKEQKKILSARIVDLESHMGMKESDVARLEKELSLQMEQVKKLQTSVTDKKLYDETLLKKFDEYNTKLQEVTQELLMSKIENERLVSRLGLKTQVIENLRKDMDEIQEINNDIMERKDKQKGEESTLVIARKSSTNLSYKSDESFKKILVIENEQGKIKDNQRSFASVSKISVTDGC